MLFNNIIKYIDKKIMKEKKEIKKKEYIKLQKRLLKIKSEIHKKIDKGLL